MNVALTTLTFRYIDTIIRDVRFTTSTQRQYYDVKFIIFSILKMATGKCQPKHLFRINRNILDLVFIIFYQNRNAQLLVIVIYYIMNVVLTTSMQRCNRNVEFITFSKRGYYDVTLKLCHLCKESNVDHHDDMVTFLQPCIAVV